MLEKLHWAKLGQKVFQQLGTEEGENKAVPTGIPCAKQAQGPRTFPNGSLPATATVKVQRNTDLSNLLFSEEVHALLLPHSSRFWRGSRLPLLYPLLHKPSPPSSSPHCPHFSSKPASVFPACYSWLLLRGSKEGWKNTGAALTGFLAAVHKSPGQPHSSAVLMGKHSPAPRKVLGDGAARTSSCK